MRNKVLLVDDSQIVQQMYKNKLTLEQFNVITADNGMEAIKMLSTEVPDIILLDLMMPVMDGYKVLQVVKTDPRLSHLPVVVFSAKGQSEEVEKALSLGAAGFIVKATTRPNEVVEQIKKIVSQKPAVQEIARYVVEIKRDAHDAQKLISDFGLNDLKCDKCQSSLLLDLISDFSHEETWFSGRFFCPQCKSATK
ncbi:MAG: response regulator [Nitrospirota bacterium]